MFLTLSLFVFGVGRRPAGEDWIEGESICYILDEMGNGKRESS